MSALFTGHRVLNDETIKLVCYIINRIYVKFNCLLIFIMFLNKLL